MGLGDGENLKLYLRAETETRENKQAIRCDVDEAFISNLKNMLIILNFF